jgi:hypothetical protein
MTRRYTVVVSTVRELTCEVEADSEAEAIGRAKDALPLSAWSLTRRVSTTVVSTPRARRKAAIENTKGACFPLFAQPRNAQVMLVDLNRGRT